MNLRHIDEFLERHSAGWKPFKGDFKMGGNPAERAVQGFHKGLKDFYEGFGQRSNSWYTSLSRGDIPGAFEGLFTGKTGTSEKKNIAFDRQRASESAANLAAHNAEVEQLAAGALGTVALRRRRGSAATRLTGSPAMGGASPQSTGKTMLSQ